MNNKSQLETNEKPIQVKLVTTKGHNVEFKLDANFDLFEFLNEKMEKEAAIDWIFNYILTRNSANKHEWLYLLNIVDKQTYEILSEATTDKGVEKIEMVKDKSTNTIIQTNN